MVILELRELAQVLELKVNSLQKEFTSIADQLAALRRKWSEVEDPERPGIVKEQEALKEKQLLLADQVNIWRDRLRSIETPAGEQALKASMEELLGCGDPQVVAAVERSKQLIAMDPEEKAVLFGRAAAASANTPVGRLIERARSSYDLRNGGPGFRQEAAVEFANRSGMSQDDSVIADLGGSVAKFGRDTRRRRRAHADPNSAVPCGPRRRTRHRSPGRFRSSRKSKIRWSSRC